METEMQVTNSAASSIYVNRPAYTQVKLNESLDLQITEPSLKDCFRSKISFSKNDIAQNCSQWFPFVNVIKSYRLRHVIGDVIAGISLSVMHVPQGLGFALLAGVPPVYGLYSSFFPNLIYFLFGTSRHACLGTMALISTLIGAVVERETGNLDLNPQIPNSTWTNDMSVMYEDTTVNNTSPETETSKLTAMRVGIATSMSLLVGVFQIAMGVFKLGGVVIRYMPSSFVGGFTTGAAFHIIIGQMKSLLGMTFPIFPGTFQMPKTIIFIFKNIYKVNLVALLVGVLCIIALAVIKIVNNKLKSKLKFPLPAELIVVITVTLIAHFSKISEHYSLEIVGALPRGFQTPAVPPMLNLDHYLVDALITALVSFAISISLVKLFAEKYQYSVGVNQETFAYGMCNAVSSFFLCFAGAIAPPRCFVFESSGGFSQVANLISSVCLLLIILVMGPLFHDLPHSALAAIIIVAVFPLVLQFKNLKRLWVVNKWDCVIWLVTWVAVFLLDIALGVVIDIGFCMIVVLMQTHSARAETLQPTEHADVFVTQLCLNNQTVHKNIKIVRCNGMLCFANAENLKEQIDDSLQDFLISACPQPTPKEDIMDAGNGVQVDVKINQVKDEETQAIESEENSSPESDQLVNTCDGKVVIFDCSAVTYIDYTGLNILTQIRKQLDHDRIRLYLANCNYDMIRKLTTHGWPEHYLDYNIFPSLQDAVARAHATDFE